MAERLGDLTRTHTCGALRPDDVGADVVLLGWVHRVRDLGGLLFIDVRDRDGVTQVVFDKDDEALMTKAKRPGKVFLDWSQNSGSKTTISPYSLRGLERPTVAAPLTWDEVEEGAEDDLALEQLTMDQVLERVARLGDVFEA